MCTRVVAFCLNGLFALEPAGVAKQKMRAPNLTLPGVALGAWQYVDVKVQWVLCGRSSPRLVGTPGLCGRRAPLCQADGRGCQITSPHWISTSVCVRAQRESPPWCAPGISAPSGGGGSPGSPTSLASPSALHLLPSEMPSRRADSTRGDTLAGSVSFRAALLGRSCY